jgi:hypothetical protein
MRYRRSMNASHALAAMLRSPLSFLILVALCNAVAPALHAQTGSASILGRVTDQKDAVVPDAEIQIKNVDTGFTVSSKSNGDGLYLIPSLNPGNYSWL